MDYEEHFKSIKAREKEENEKQSGEEAWYKKEPATPAKDEYEGLSYQARKRKDRQKKILKISITGACILFFLFTFLSLRTFGSDNYYTIQRGENLYRISRKFNVPLNILLSLNEMNNPDVVEEGTRIKIPTEHDVHTIKKGETLLDIAREYGVKHYVLVKYNKLTGSKGLKPGDRIFIPRVLSDIHIAARNTTGLAPFVVHFDVTTNTRDRIKSYFWDFGDNGTSRERSPYYTYKEKGAYKATLTVVDENNHKIASNTLTIDVRRLANIQFNTPDFIEVGAKGDVISLNAKAIDNMGEIIDFNFRCTVTGEPVLIKQIERSDKFRVTGTGYSKITVSAEGFTHTGYYFVSPIPSDHSSRNDLNWYKTQFNTGINGNCGPTCVSMAIKWAKGIDVPVRKIREYVGLPDPRGGVGLYLLVRALKKYQIEMNLFRIKDIEDLFDVIDRGNIIIILFNRGSISVAKGDYDNNLFGRYYTDSGGHYIIVKGYSKNKKYFVVYDPMPADWWKNRFRYRDNESMAGRNRYYAVSEVLTTLSKSALEILK
jgi:LysM repeat protein